MTSLTEARRAVLALKEMHPYRTESSTYGQIAILSNYLESQVAASVELDDLRARLARAETPWARFW